LYNIRIEKIFQQVASSSVCIYSKAERLQDEDCMPLNISRKVREKLLNKHHVQVEEIWQCFLNRVGAELTDTREQHATNPPTRWFIAYTDQQRLLKVVYVPSADGAHIRTAYPPNDAEIKIYCRFAGGH
jgi:uncharacterized DUF497 family protein